MTHRGPAALALAFVVVTAGVATSGVVGLSLPSRADRPPVTSDILSTTGENSTEYETFSATVVFESRSARRNSTATARVWANRSSGAYRIENLDPENASWDVVVSNGSRVWAYHGEEEMVVTTDDVHGRFVENVLGWVKPLRYDDLFYSRADLAERLDLYHVRSLGRETLDGRDAFVLQLGRSAPASRSAPETTTLWLDANRSFPVRVASTSDTGIGDEYHQRLTYRNLTFDESVDPSRFTYDPPAGVNVTHPDELRPFPVREPSLPADFRYAGSGTSGASTYENGTEIVRHRTFEARYQNLTTTVTVENHTYPNPREPVTVVERPDAIRANLDARLPWPANESVAAPEIGNATGAAWTANGTAYAVWPCSGSYYVVRAPLSQSAVIEVARTIPCGNAAESTSVALARDAEIVDGEPVDGEPVDADPTPANATRIAPGVTTAEIVSPAGLLAAHHRSVEGGDFAAVVNETRTVRRANATETLELGQRFRYDAASGTYLATYRNESATNRGPTVVWGNATAAVARTSAYGHDFYQPAPAPSSSVPTGSSYLLSAFTRYDFAVRETTALADSNRTRFLLEDDAADVEAVLVLDPEGRIYSFTLSGDSGGDTRRVEYRLLDERDVPRLEPEWVTGAPADAEFRGRVGMEVQPNYVYLSHYYGEVIPAGTVVELTTGGETYSTELSEPLRPDGDRQLYVLNGSLVVTSRHPEAKAFGENLSSPVRLLLYTEERVLVFHESFRWSSDDRLSVASGFGPRAPTRYSRS